MSDIPPPGFDEPHQPVTPPTEPPPDREGELAIGRQLHEKILALQEHPVYKGHPNEITEGGVEIVRGIKPASAWGIELHRQSGDTIFQVEGESHTDHSQVMYKLAPDGQKPERLGLGINGIVNGKPTTFFLEVTSDGSMEGLMQTPGGKPYILAPVPVDTRAMPAFTRDMVEQNSTHYAQQIIDRRQGKQ